MRRWPAALATAALHGGLFAALLGSGGGRPGATSPEALRLRLLAPAPLRPVAVPPPKRPAAPTAPSLPALPLPEIALALVTPQHLGRAAAPPPAAPTAAAAVPPPATEARVDPVSRAAEREHCPPALYPALLRERGIEGLVRVRVQVGAQGEALAVQLAGSSGFRLFDEAALAQARACRYRPALQDGQQAASWVEFPARFALQ